MMAKAATDEQATAMMANWLHSPDHFCIAPSGDFAGRNMRVEYAIIAYCLLKNMYIHQATTTRATGGCPLSRRLTLPSPL
jgi:hypothetical protein